MSQATLGVVVDISSILFPVGWSLYRAGLTKKKYAINVLIKLFVDIVFGCVSYWLIGSALANGHSLRGVIGSTNFVPFSSGDDNDSSRSVFSDWFSQLCVAIGCCSLASSGLVEQSYMFSEMLLSVLVSVFLNPTVTHWLWHPNGWLKVNGYQESAGTGPLHLVGGTCAFTLLLLNRIKKMGHTLRTMSTNNRYLRSNLGKHLSEMTGDKAVAKKSGHSPVIAIMGSVLSILGLLFVPFVYDRQLGSRPLVMLNQCLALSGGALAAVTLTKLITGKWSAFRFYHGAVSGYVSASAGFNQYYAWVALIVGLCGGCVHVLVRNVAIRLRMKDNADAISTFFIPGILSILSMGTATAALSSNPTLFLWFLVASLAIFTWCFAAVFILFAPFVLFCAQSTMLDKNMYCRSRYIREQTMDVFDSDTSRSLPSGTTNLATKDPTLMKPRLVTGVPDGVLTTPLSPRTATPFYLSAKHRLSSTYESLPMSSYTVDSSSPAQPSAGVSSVTEQTAASPTGISKPPRIMLVEAESDTTDDEPGLDEAETAASGAPKPELAVRPSSGPAWPGMSPGTLHQQISMLKPTRSSCDQPDRLA